METLPERSEISPFTARAETAPRDGRVEPGSTAAARIRSPGALVAGDGAGWGSRAPRPPVRPPASVWVRREGTSLWSLHQNQGSSVERESGSPPETGQRCSSGDRYFKEVQGSFGADMRSCGDATGRLQAQTQPLPAHQSRVWLSSTGGHWPSPCQEPGSARGRHGRKRSWGDAQPSHSTGLHAPGPHGLGKRGRQGCFHAGQPRGDWGEPWSCPSALLGFLICRGGKLMARRGRGDGFSRAWGAMQALGPAVTCKSDPRQRPPVTALPLVTAAAEAAPQQSAQPQPCSEEHRAGSVLPGYGQLCGTCGSPLPITSDP